MKVHLNISELATCGDLIIHITEISVLSRITKNILPEL